MMLCVAVLMCGCTVNGDGKLTAGEIAQSIACTAAALDYAVERDTLTEMERLESVFYLTVICDEDIDDEQDE